jgi:hypothetical protein
VEFLLELVKPVLLLVMKAVFHISVAILDGGGFVFSRW